ncbi:MAG: hypothetical protein R3F43_22090 [bacterium]
MKTKFYNFDDLLIDGEYKKPQVLYTDARQKVKFERFLKLKKDFLLRLGDREGRRPALAGRWRAESPPPLARAVRCVVRGPGQAGVASRRRLPAADGRRSPIGSTRSR